jgi:hypothetical protein
MPGWYEYPMTGWGTLWGLVLLSTTYGCAQSPYAHGGHPTGLSRYDVERDYAECEYKARLANEQHFYSSSSPFPFGSGPQSPADHARALHGLTTINAMRDTCLAAKGYRLN